MTVPTPSWHIVLLAALLMLGACEEPVQPVIQPLPALPAASTGNATPRINGVVGATDAPAVPLISLGQGQSVTLPAARANGVGQVSLDFADTDIREVVKQILGTMLGLNYTIDPTVHGTATLHTSTPIATDQLLGVVQTLLAQNNAMLLQADGIYRVSPAGGGAGSAAASTALSLASNSAVAGSTVVQLRYASADDLARLLQPFAGGASHIGADPGRNVLLISGDPTAREALISLVQAFDVDVLAGQSYALFPATSGDAKDLAASLQDAFRSQGALSGVVRVVPMARINAVLVVASQERIIDDARRVFSLVQRSQRTSVRSWHVYYLQSSLAEESAYVLQRAFTPNDVTAQPSEHNGPSTAQHQTNSSFQGSAGGGTVGGANGGLSNGALGANGPGLTAGAGTQGNAPQQTQGAATAPAASANPLFGGLDQTASGADPNAMRIIPNTPNNALLIYATQSENDTVEAMLRKIDILPLQVRIDATIAEVTLNDRLQYGTQFFFKSGGINGILNNATGPVGSPVNTVLGTVFPGFFLGGTGQGGAPFAINALQAVTTVHVLSSPEIMVLDNQPARLQVGNLVPFLTTSSQSTIGSGAPVINSIGYQPTGVIMQVTPRVNSGGLVTLDISQEVSDVDTTQPPASGIDSPTFLERSISSRVVVQDGQTIGLAGLIRDNTSRGNSGIPWLKDIPLLGLLAGSQNNQRSRTELLVLITPHVVQDQRSARALTEDMRDELVNAAAVSDELRDLKPSGSDDPGRRLRHALRLQR